MNKLKLSIAMIVKNEEKHIEECLKPLRRLQDFIDSEIVVVDTGSTDNTVQIAKKYTNKVYFHKWNNNFSDMRNISLSYCTGEWILIVDGDEILYDVEKVVEFINDEKTNGFNAALIKIINFDKTIENSLNNGVVAPLLRIFKNGTVKYSGSIHEQPIFKTPVLDTDIRFIHYGYDNNDYKLMEYKFKRNLDLLIKEHKRNTDNIYIIYQIAVSYHMHNDIKQALKYIEMAYRKCRNQIKKYIYVLNKYCSILYKLNKYEVLLEKAEEGLKYEKFIDFYFYKGEACYSLCKYKEAIKAYKNYLNCREQLKNGKFFNPMLIVNTMGMKNNILCKLSFSYYKSKLYEPALKTLLKIKDKNFLMDKILIALKIIDEGKLWSKILCLNNLIDKYNYEGVLLYFHNEVLLEDLNTININKLKKGLKEIVSLVKHYKENGKIDEIYLKKIKNIIDREREVYSIYVYYALKYDVNEIKYFITYGKDKIENILLSLCANYYEFNNILLEGLKTIKSNNIEDIFIRTSMEKALLLSGKLPSNEKKDMFLNYIAEKYYCNIKCYNNKLIKESTCMLTSEDRFIIELKNIMQYRYENTLKYIKSIKKVLNIEKPYVDYVKLLIDESIENVNNEVKALVPQLLKNINLLLDDNKYQEAYDTIEEALSLVKFDFNLMMVKYNLLIQFNYEEEAKKCLRDIILYGDSNKVNELIAKI